MFGFSLNEEADKYYNELKKSQGKIGETKIQGLSFDATSSKNVEGKSIKWIDALYTNLSILTVDSKPLLIPITDKSKIEAFKKTISSLPNLSPEVKKDLITWIESWTVELNYYKDPEGFNDRILPRIKTREVVVSWTVETPKIVETPYIDVYNPVHSTLNLVWAWVWDKKEDKEEEEAEKSETEEAEKSETEEAEKSETEEAEKSQTEEAEKSETEEAESSETEEPESSETEEPESSETQEPESSETQEPESSETQTKPISDDETDTEVPGQSDE